MAKIQELLEDARKQSEALAWEGTFEEYLDMAMASPQLARHAHSRLYDMVQWSGSDPGTEGVPEYGLFAGEIFGLDRALDRLVEYFHAASRSPEVRKRVLLLMGPPASGKSSIVNILKQGLERYTRTTEGAVYAIKGCPMQEEPLHLIPDERRKEMVQDHGLYIEGDLCPRCRHNLRYEYGGDLGRVKVQRVVFSQSAGIGVGSFVATSPQSQDISRLVGTVDTSWFTDDRLEGAGKGLRLDGELEAANRGIMEFIEMFKSDERYLTVVLGVTQERTIKLGSFGSVYADEAVIAHTNQEEYKAFVDAKETAALLDRLILVRVPYVLRVSDEAKIYHRMLLEGGSAGTDRSGEPHSIAPLTIPVAAVLSVLSRLEPVARGSALPRLPLLEKMRLYDGRVVPPYTWPDVEKLHEESPEEGMLGLSPRYVINRLADALTRKRGCLTPAEALKSLLDGLVERAGFGQEERSRVTERLQEAFKEYKELAVREVQREATEDFDQKASDLFGAYGRDAESLLNRQADAVGGPTSPPEEGLLRRVEGGLNLRESDRLGFRRDVYRRYGYLRVRPRRPGPDHDSIPLLKLAIENVLFTSREELRLTLDPRSRDPARRRAREAIAERLISGRGYCQECCEDLLYFAWRTLRGKDELSVKGGTVTWGRE